MAEDRPTPPAESPPSRSAPKPWPMAWILIAILLYALLQMTYFVFFAKA